MTSTESLNEPGDILESIQRGIETCDCALAILTRTSPNVMHELGLAHANNKSIILLIEREGEGDLDLPFDIDNYAYMEYQGVDESLKDRIRANLENVRDQARYARVRKS